MPYVDNSQITPLYANTTPDVVADANVIDPAIAAIIAATNENYDEFQAFKAAIELPIPDQSIVTRHLRNLAVTNPKLAPLAVTADKIANGAITLEKLADLVITAAKIADGTITESKYATGSVSKRAIAPNAVDATKMDPSLFANITDISINARFGQIDAQLAEKVTYKSSVNAMKTDTTLIIGQRVVTQGYYSPQDGGGAEYLIVPAGTGTDNVGSYHDLSGIAGQAELMVSDKMSPKVFGARPVSGFDNLAIFNEILDYQCTFTATETVLKKPFTIVMDGVYEISDTFFLKPFVSIIGPNNPVETFGQNGCGFKAVGDFTSKTVLSTAPIIKSTGLRASGILYETASQIHDADLYAPCGNITIENIIITAEGNVSTCPFEAIHLIGSNGSVIRSNFTTNTIQGMTVMGCWQVEITRNKHDCYWIGALYSDMTGGISSNNYYYRGAVSRLAIWTDVQTRPFFNKLIDNTVPQVYRRNLGFVIDRAGLTYIENVVENFSNGVGIVMNSWYWNFLLLNTYIENVTENAYCINTNMTLDITMGTMVDIFNLVDLLIKDGNGSPNRVFMKSTTGGEFNRVGNVTNLGTVSVTVGDSQLVLTNFQKGSRKYANYVVYDNENVVKSLGFTTVDSYETGLIFNRFADPSLLKGGYGNGSLIPFVSRDNNALNPTNTPSVGISCNTSTLISAANKGSWQVVNRSGYALSMRIVDAAWSSWVDLLTSAHGTTAQRPTQTVIGQQYFDTTLNKPIWHNGTNWVDAAGTTV